MGELVVHLVRGFLASNKPLSRHHPRGAGLKTVFYYYYIYYIIILF